LRWAHLHGFFKDLDTDESVGRDEGYVRVKPTMANHTRLAATRPEPAAAVARIPERIDSPRPDDVAVRE
jgi:hypothetical protein